MASNSNHHVLENLRNDVLKQRLEKYRHYLVKNLQVYDIAVSRQLSEIISSEIQEIMKLDRSAEITNAANAFLDAFLQSRNPSKWTKLKEVLSKPVHELIVDILVDGATQELINHDKLQKKLESYKKDIMEVLDPNSTIPFLQQEELLNGDQSQKVIACSKTSGDEQANFLILIFVPRNKHWFPKFMRVLWTLNHVNLVTTIDKDIAKELKAELGQPTYRYTTVTYEAHFSSTEVSGCENTSVKAVGQLTTHLAAHNGTTTSERRLQPAGLPRQASQGTNLRQLPASTSAVASSLARSVSPGDGRTSVSQPLGFSSKNLRLLTEAANRENKNTRKLCTRDETRDLTSSAPDFSNPKSSIEQSLTYEYCGKLVTTVTAPKIHKTKVHGPNKDNGATGVSRTLQDQGKEIESNTFPCSVCDRPFKTEKGMKIHRTSMHGKTTDQTQKKIIPQQREPNIPETSLRGRATNLITSADSMIISPRRGQSDVDRPSSDRMSLSSLTSGNTSSRSVDSLEEEGVVCNECGRLCKNEKGLKIHKGHMH